MDSVLARSDGERRSHRFRQQRPLPAPEQHHMAEDTHRIAAVHRERRPRQHRQGRGDREFRHRPVGTLQQHDMGEAAQLRPDALHHRQCRRQRPATTSSSTSGAAASGSATTTAPGTQLHARDVARIWRPAISTETARTKSSSISARRGLWVRLNNASWVKLHTRRQLTSRLAISTEAARMMRSSTSARRGIWIRYNNATWTQAAHCDIAGTRDGRP